MIAWIIYLLGLHFLTNVGPFGNIISRLTAADQELIAYLAVAGVLLLYEIIIFFCVLGGSRKQGRDGNTIDNGRGLTSFIIIAAGSYLSAVFASLIPQIPAALQGIQSALTVYGSLKNTLLPICAAGVVSCIIRKFIINSQKHRGRIECPVFFHFFYFFFLTRIFLINFRISQIITIIRKRSPAQIPTIIPANLFGCFNRSTIFLLSSTTFRPCVVL